MILEYDNTAIWSSSFVYIFQKGIVSFVLCGYEVQLNVYIFDVERSQPLNMIFGKKLCTVRLKI